MITGQWSWLPALAALGRDDTRLGFLLNRQFSQHSAAAYVQGKQNRRIMATCGDQHETVPDRIVKA